MNYTQLKQKNKDQIDILLEQGLSMRKVASILGISHSTISRYKSGVYKKRKIDITERYSIFLDYLYTHYDRRTNSIEICIYMFKKRYKGLKCPTYQQVYNWINDTEGIEPDEEVKLDDKYFETFKLADDSQVEYAVNYILGH